MNENAEFVRLLTQMNDWDDTIFFMCRRHHRNYSGFVLNLHISNRTHIDSVCSRWTYCKSNFHHVFMCGLLVFAFDSIHSLCPNACVDDRNEQCHLILHFVRKEHSFLSAWHMFRWCGVNDLKKWKSIKWLNESQKRRSDKSTGNDENTTKKNLNPATAARWHTLALTILTIFNRIIISFVSLAYSLEILLNVEISFSFPPVCTTVASMQS